MKPIELKDQNEIQLEIVAQATKKTVLWGKKYSTKITSCQVETHGRYQV